MDDPKRLYDCLLDYCSSQTIQRIALGQVWTVCQTRDDDKLSSGLAMTSALASRTLQWPGTLVGRPLKDIAAWVNDWQPSLATVGMAAINCGINSVIKQPKGIILDVQSSAANLNVFEHFLPQTIDKKVVVIGHYPGIESYVEQYGWTVLERSPVNGDYPDPASEFIIPDADWVFLSASTIPNKTFPRLAELAQSATTVLMGPTTPWLPELYQFGIDYLAGVKVVDAEALYQTACEGGGVRIFETGVRYNIVELSQQHNLDWLKCGISDSYQAKQTLTSEMEQWYGQGHCKRYPQYDQLNDINQRLSRMDSAYKTLWDSQQK
ncbi:DUF364 domain-containing protein [Methylophaga sp.]|uniref:DUF364 domain-containing protein n=1 Tax=Methylophaga sp. TaxID=2024840 RepID=UPI0027179E9E|nr:DUF364 domain-containing protein [Methylophaga sp.]MDO8828095.1 DUF364 domain-containing protein [Methylophaga sp.]